MTYAAGFAARPAAWRWPGTAALGAALAAFAALAAGPAAAATFDASYRASLAGITVGRAAVTGSHNGSSYRIAGRGALSGIGGLFGDHSGDLEIHGTLDGRQPTSLDLRVGYGDDRERNTVRLRMENREVREVVFEPDRPDHPARVALANAHKRNVIDPVSALVVPGGFSGGNFDAGVCDRTVPVFSGRERFDIALSYNGVRTVSSQRSGGYSGPVMVCTARYTPVAGHRADRDGVSYIAQRSFEVMFAPVADTGVLIPYRVAVPTPLGQAVLQLHRVGTR